MKKLTLFLAILLCTVWMAYGQWTYTNLSEPKLTMGSAALGNKVYFAGGDNGSEFLSEVQVYDVINKTWETLDGGLFYARIVPGGSVACGSKVFFAGGFDWVTSFNTVDIYDTETEEWEVQFLSDDRFSIASVSHGDTVMFAGGLDYPAVVCKSVVDIYNIQTGEWSTTNLSIAREGIASAVVGNLALFAGGFSDNGVTDRVDIYNFTDNTWSQETLSQARGYASAVTVGTKVIIAGGATSYNNPTDRVDIYDASTNTWSQAALSSPRSALNNGAAVGGKAYFAGGGNFSGAGFNNPSDVVDIYDEASNTWSVMNLQEPRVNHSVMGVGDYLVVAGGSNDSGNLSSVEIYHHPTLINVPGDYTTIQEAINEASHYDTVLVAGGTYFENINFIGKPILLASEFILDGDTNHINNTIIDGSQAVNPDKSSVITFETGEDTTSVVCGFTITQGNGTIIPGTNYRAGGGIFVQGSGCKLENNCIEYNQMVGDNYTLGGGICVGGPVEPLPWIVLRNNCINHNTAISNYGQGSGGGMEIYYPLIMENNHISYNLAQGINFAIGGGARLCTAFGPVELNVRNNQINNNSAESTGLNTILVISGGITLNGDVSGYFSHNTVSNNFNLTDGASYGPGLCVDEAFAGNLYIENNFLINNSFAGGTCIGGGLSIYNSKGFFKNNVIMGNTATNGGGIAIEENLSNKAILINNTVSGNDAPFGPGLWASLAKAVVVNTIIYNNTPTGSNAIFEENSDLEVHYSDIEGDEVWPGEGNLNCTPTFLADGYHLDEACQLVNSGINSIEINGAWYECPPYDIDGDVRPYLNTHSEIGVDEVPVLETGVSVSSSGLSINLYPNPADQVVTVSLQEDAAIDKVILYNQVGQKVYSGTPENNTLDVSKLQPGIYLIEVRCDQQKFREKLILE